MEIKINRLANALSNSKMIRYKYLWRPMLLREDLIFLMLHMSSIMIFLQLMTIMFTASAELAEPKKGKALTFIG